MLRLIISQGFILFVILLNAQSDSTWTTGGFSTLTFSQVSLNNWASGGENSATVNGLFSFYANKASGNITWQNSFEMAYGILKQGRGAVRKSEDRMTFSTRFGYQIKEDSKWSFTTFGDFRSQFVEGFSAENPDSVISRFLAPAYLTVGSGLSYENKGFTFGYKPATGKITVVTDEEIIGVSGAYGVEANKKSRVEIGSFLRIAWKGDVLKNVNLSSSLELFTNYESETFGNVDVNWQNTIFMQVNAYLSANFFAHLLYDDDIKTERIVNGINQAGGAKIQFKNVFGVGLVYKLGSEKSK